MMPLPLPSEIQMPKMPHLAASSGVQSRKKESTKEASMASPRTSTRRAWSLPRNVNVSMKHCLTLLQGWKTVSLLAVRSEACDRKPDPRSGEPVE